MLTVVDIFSKFSPLVDPRFSYCAKYVVMTLEKVCGKTGYPKTICVDRGSKFISRDLDLWAYHVVLSWTSKDQANRLTMPSFLARQAITRNRRRGKLQWQVQNGMIERPLVQ